MNKILCVILFVIFTKCYCQDGANLKSRAFARWKNYASEFFEEKQMSKAFDIAVDCAYDGKNVSEAGNAIIDYLMGNLAVGQLSKITSFGLGLISYYKPGISGFIDFLTTHISNNVAPFYVQVQGEMLKMKEKGEEKQYITNQAYYMALNMFTAKKIEGIFCRFKNKLTPAVWSKLYTNVLKYKIFKVDLYETVCV